MNKQQALEMAIEMLEHIANGGTFGMIEYHEKLRQLEKARDSN